MKAEYGLAVVAGVLLIVLTVMAAGLNIVTDDMQREYDGHCYWPASYLGPCRELQTKITAVRGIISDVLILFVVTLLVGIVCTAAGSRSGPSKKHEDGDRFCPSCGSRSSIGEFCLKDGTKLKEVA